jgi:uracil-DNA glycosylase
MQDQPKCLGQAGVREARMRDIHLPHVRPLNDMVAAWRAVKGPAFEIPYFDPMDGGTKAECLFLLEAPGPKAVEAGFVSRNNPDETARNFFLLNAEAGLDRRRTVTWNICPWYVGTATKIRPVSRADIRDARDPLGQLLQLLPNLRLIALVGKKAALERGSIEALSPGAAIVEMPHPSPRYVNRRPGNRAVLLDALHSLVQIMDAK